MQFLIVIGAPKSGTTSLGYWLGQHPSISRCRKKEPRFFTDFAEIAWQGPGGQGFRASLIREESEYLAAFDWGDGPVWGLDASTDYLWCPAAAERLRAWADRFPTKLVCILRDPVDRIVSEYQHTVRAHMETVSLQESLALEEERAAAHWHPLFYHRRRSLYSVALNRYHALFGEDLLVLDHAELGDPDVCVGRVLDFLGLPSHEIDTRERKNVSFVYRSPAADRWMRNPKVRAAARRLFPKPFRSRIRETANTALRTRYRPTADDLQAISALLEDEIAACRRDPLVPTGTWRGAEPLRAGA